MTWRVKLRAQKDAQKQLARKSLNPVYVAARSLRSKNIRPLS